MLEERHRLIIALRAARAGAHACLSALRHIEAAIRLIQEDLDDAGAPPPVETTYEDVFEPGDITRLSIEVLQRAACPLCTVEIANAILERKGAPLLSREDAKRLLRTVHGILTELHQRGRVSRITRIRRYGMGAAGSMLWKLNERPGTPSAGSTTWSTP